MFGKRGSIAAVIIVIIAIGLAVFGVYFVFFREAEGVEVSNLTVTPSPAEYGESVTVSVEVTNTGVENGAYTIVLKADDNIENTLKVNVPKNEKKNYNFQISFNQLDKHTISVNGVSKSLEVTMPEVTYGLSDAPDIPDYSLDLYEEKPSVGAYWGPSYGFSASWKLSHLYVGHGVARVAVRNTGSNPIFVYKVGIQGEWMIDASSKDVGFTIEPSESENLGLVSFVGPEIPGNYEGRLRISVMAKGTGGNWRDYGSKLVGTSEIQFKPLGEEKGTGYGLGESYYFTKINNRVNPNASEVRAKATEIVGEYSGDYNVYQLCALFDWVSRKIEDVEDPPGEDYWSPPTETLNSGEGDCEDHAFLLAAMIEAVGGQTRIVLTENHALASVYIGNKSHAEKVQESINKYYGENLFYTFWTEGNERWLVLESSGGFYPGSLPVGAVFTENAWTFTGTRGETFVDIV